MVRIEEWKESSLLFAFWEVSQGNIRPNNTATRFPNDPCSLGTSELPYSSYFSTFVSMNAVAVLIVALHHLPSNPVVPKSVRSPRFSGKRSFEFASEM